MGYSGLKRKNDLTGERFTRLLVISICKEKTDAQKRTYWLCRYDCGNEKIVRRDGLLTKQTKSCGCLNRETIRRVYGPIENLIFSYILTKYIGAAKKRNIPFDLSVEELKEIVLKNCYYCDSEPANSFKRQGKKDIMKYSGIDRIDSSKGYTKENCVPCCWKCNCAKASMNYYEFISWINKIYTHLIDEKNIEG